MCTYRLLTVELKVAAHSRTATYLQGRSMDRNAARYSANRVYKKEETYVI